ncbi:hypothetical protein M426DRAFT_318113 [Hypoxylon sp. CI-4A]|nr:hypothetical protein M426DRAFT_318113 [Hypoxylon sp. CI-4A]
MKAVALLECLTLLFSIVLADRKGIIIDTDMLNFADDPLALGLANIFSLWGESRLIAVMSSVHSRFAPPAFDAINTFFGHPNIPVAIQKPVNNQTQWPEYLEYGDYLTGLTYNFQEDIRDGARTADPVALYRTILATSKDRSIKLAIIGFYDNLYHLLQSGPDLISPLTGAELLLSKVHEVIVQANEAGTSYNTDTHDPVFAETFLNWWPGRLTFVGDNVGDHTLVGTRITSELDVTKNPIGYAMRANIGYAQKHEAWDAAALYYAVCGLDDVFRWKYPDGGHARLNGSAYATWTNATAAPYGNGTAPGRWRAAGNAVEFGVPPEVFSSRVEDILMWQPGDHVPLNRTWCNNFRG